MYREPIVTFTCFIPRPNPAHARAGSGYKTDLNQMVLARSHFKRLGMRQLVRGLNSECKLKFRVFLSSLL